MPLSPPTLALLIAYLFDHKYVLSTVYTCISALGFRHRLAGYYDPTKSFVIGQILKGCAKIGSQLDTRLPISLPILNCIIQAATHLSDSTYNTSIPGYVFIRPFFLFVERVKSLNLRTDNQPICLDEVTKLLNSPNQFEAFKVTFLDFV